MTHLNKSTEKSRQSPFTVAYQRAALFRSPWKDIIQFATLVIAIIWLLSLSTARLGYNWQWYRIPRYLFRIDDGQLIIGELIEGLLFTLRITGVSLALSLVIGLVTALLRLSDSLMGSILTRIYLEVIRNTPLVVQVYLVYFVIGPILGMERFSAAVMALSLFEGAYMSEIFRAGIISLHKGQWEAAYSLGLSSLDKMRFVVMPQVFKRTLPTLANEFINTIKYSSIASIVSIQELTFMGRQVVVSTRYIFETWITVAAMYMLLTLSLSLITSLLERRLRQSD